MTDVRSRYLYNNSYLAACTGVACCPCVGSAGLDSRSSHVGISGFFLIDNHRFVLGFDNDFLYAANLFDVFDLLIKNICGDDVSGKRKVPLNIKCFVELSFDSLGYVSLFTLQFVTVCDCCGVGGDVFGTKLFDSCLAVKYDGYTNFIVIRILVFAVGNVVSFFCAVKFRLRKLRVNSFVYFFKLQFS